FRGNLTDQGAMLYWEMNSTPGIAMYNVQRSADRVNYQTISAQNNDGQTNFSYGDATKFEGAIYYRIQLVYQDGHNAYSQILALDRYANDLLQITALLPNPATDQLTLSFYAKEPAAAEIMICNAYGQRLSTRPFTFNTGYNRFTLPVNNLASGVYFLLVKGKNIQSVKRFVKMGQP
ncbi:MAG TPA: T9SS type A sorting domain-containing protein, partial [Puia sp.]|nr:T9SS type A sorting domain-containing protein [Puia sp.]